MRTNYLCDIVKLIRLMFNVMLKNYPALLRAELLQLLIILKILQ